MPQEGETLLRHFRGRMKNGKFVFLQGKRGNGEIMGFTKKSVDYPTVSCMGPKYG